MAATRTATVMFTDLVASTARAARTGPARADEFRAEHFGFVRSVIELHRGTAVKTMGDGVMAVFDSGAAAVDAAVAIQQAIDASNRTNPDASELRVGLSVGEVSEDNGDVFGTAVVEAARLCADAQPRQILCTSLVARLAAAHCAHRFSALGERTLKGLPTAVAVEQVVWMPLVESGLQADFAHVDERAWDAKACLDLQQQSPFFQELRRRIIEQLAPRPSQVVVDVGCGNGHDVFVLGRLVGPSGRAIGVDISEALVAEAAGRAADERVGNVEFRLGDAMRLDLAEDSVDGARSDRVFQYLVDPDAALRELIRVTRPGGRIVVADTDWRSSTFDSDDDELSARVEAGWTRTRASGIVGRRLFGMFTRAGLLDVRVFAHTNVVTDIDDPVTAELYREMVVPSYATQAVDAGTVTPEEAARWLGSQTAATAERRFFRFLVMFAVSGTVPN